MDYLNNDEQHGYDQDQAFQSWLTRLIEKLTDKGSDNNIGDTFNSLDKQSKSKQSLIKNTTLRELTIDDQIVKDIHFESYFCN